MDTVPRWLLLRRWTVLRFAVKLGRSSAERIHWLGPPNYQAELREANRYAWVRWLVLTYRVTDWPTTLPSETTPLSRYLERPRWRS